MIKGAVFFLVGEASMLVAAAIVIMSYGCWKPMKE
jgi:hypothetical protein